MATKEQNIVRLGELAVILGRNVDVTGNAAEIQQRVNEWEVEAAELSSDGNGSDGADTETGSQTGTGTETGSETGSDTETVTGAEAGGDTSSQVVPDVAYETVTLLRTTHLNALAELTDDAVKIAVKGTRVRVTPARASVLAKAKLVSRG